MFQLHRIFVATPWEMEQERSQFHDIIGRFNETSAMPAGVLYIPVTLVNVAEKRAVQHVVDQNIADARHYIVLLSDDWGPAPRNFENDYLLALKCSADPALPGRETALLRKIPLSGRGLAPGMPEPQASFSTPAEFEQCINTLLSSWLTSLLEESKTHGCQATA